MRFLLFSLLICSSLFAFAQSNIDVQHYRFEVELSDASDAITGKATVTVKFLEPSSVLQLDLAGLEDEKGMKVFAVMEGISLLTATQSAEQLSIRLAKPAVKDEVRTFKISYIGTPKDGLIISKNKFGERTFFSDHWPNRAHQWLPVHDVPDDKANFEFIITAPAKYSVISNGKKLSEKMLGSKKQTHWREDVPLSTKIMAVGVARFAVKTFADSPKGIPVSAWSYPQDSAKLFYDYAVAPSIVTFFSNYIASFPYSKLANVQSTTIFGGMENAGAIFYAEDLVSGKRLSESTIAHEIAHQWFGDAASEKSFAHLWLSEGFATYLTHYYFEKKYGRDSAAHLLRRDKETVIGFLHQQKRPVVDSTTDLMSLLNANSYQKGGWVLHMLRQEVGDTAFRKILQTYYQQYKGSNADSRDFEAIAEKVSGKELTPFFDQWLYRTGIPQLKITKTEKGDSVELKVEQKQPDLYQFILPVSIESGNTKGKTLLWQIKDRMQTVNIPKGAKYIIDPYTSLLFEEVK